LTKKYKKEVLLFSYTHVREKIKLQRNSCFIENNSILSPFFVEAESFLKDREEKQKFF